MEQQYNCRTCLEVVDGRRCTEVSKNCYLDQSIKKVIVLLVPSMDTTLSDDDLICRNCLRILKSTMKFIERCLEVEIIYAENKEQEEDFEDDAFSEDDGQKVEVDENSIIYVKPTEHVDQDHDYHVKNEIEEYVDITDTTLVENDDNFQQDSESQPIEIVLDSSVVNMEASNESCDNFEQPIEFIFENSSSSYNEITLENTQESDNVESGGYDGNVTLEYVTDDNNKNISYPTYFQQLSSENESNLADLTCQYCKKIFKTHYAHRRHIKIHEDDSSCKICELCGKFFDTNTSLNIHINNEHINDGENSESTYMCDKCPKIYKNKFKLGNHMKMVHEKVEQQQCQECGKLFQNKESCENHFRLIHLQLKPFVCDVCGKEFGRKDYLQKHMYNHTGEPRPKQTRNAIKNKNRRGKPPKFGIRLKDPGTPVDCKICGKMILSVHLLKSHLQSHVKIKRHKCNFCELSFTLANNRDRHQRLHEVDPEKRFRCNICWKRMRTEDELSCHMVRHYNRPPQHACDICGEKFHRRYLLDNHHLDKHTYPGDIERAEKEIVIDNLLEYAHPYKVEIEDEDSE